MQFVDGSGMESNCFGGPNPYCLQVTWTCCYYYPVYIPSLIPSLKTQAGAHNYTHSKDSNVSSWISCTDNHSCREPIGYQRTLSLIGL